MMIKKRLLIAVLVAAASLSMGCNSPSASKHSLDGAVDRIEIFYRDFDTLAPIRYSTTELIRSATFKAAITDREKIDSFLELITLTCEPTQDVSRDRIDIYLLVREYKSSKLVKTWEASRFHFYQAPGSNEPCKLHSRNRESIKRAIAQMQADVSP